IKDIGMSVTEGRAGAFRDTIQQAVRLGSKHVELSLNMGGQAGVASGAESYGKDEREELKEIAKANELNIMSVHTPSNIGNLSGYAGPQQGFDDTYRKKEMDELKQAIAFAGDVTNGSAVVIHTGEFTRPISEAKWAKDEQGNQLFKGYDEEIENAVIPIVDRRTGKLLMQVRKNQLVYRPKWLKNDGGDYVDYEGNVIDRLDERVPEYDEKTGRFEVEERDWDFFEKEAKETNDEKIKDLGRPLKENEVITTEIAFLNAQLQTNIAQSRGWARYHSKGFSELQKKVKQIKEAKEFYDKLDESLPDGEKWKLMRESDPNRYSSLAGILPSESKSIPDLLNEELRKANFDLEHIKDSSIGYEQQAMESELMKNNAMPVSQYAKKQSMKSYVEAGIFAMEKSQENKTDKPIFIAPENIFPEMGYGSHPEELIELVTDARKEMIIALSERKIEDPHGRTDENGNIRMIKNPNYQGYSKSEAAKKAKDHIKATWDTAHMGMWWKYFEPRHGESEIQRKGRFDKWYLKQVEKMKDADIIGHIHAVDSFGYGDPHIPIGEGNLPVKTALEYLKEKGYTGTMMSEAFSKGPGRQMLKTWAHLGSTVSSANIYGGGASGAGGVSFGDIHQSYFGQHRAPYTIFGAYAPSNDWTLWTQVP
ncbi:MAG: hypothetical protein KAQ83_04500, partial [Nanoarchaeota archaeon]|nr:hypothetical protein [Nanoarchaeota archaeon]